MKEWCNNELGINGENATLAEFRREVEGEDQEFSLDSLYQMPEELEFTNPRKDKPNWYEWRCKHWGTPLDVEWAVLSLASGKWLEYKFFSADGPPIAWLKKVSRDYPELQFDLAYGENGYGFAGYAVVKNGEVTYQKEEGE